VGPDKNLDVLGEEERFRQSQIFRVAIFSEDRPRGLQASALDENGVEKKKACFSQAIFTDGVSVISLDHKLDALELLQLQWGIETFTL
jgi:hypothetical protein